MKFLNFFRRIPFFFKEVYLELSKSSWSTKKEVFHATLVVLFGTTLLTLFIWAADILLGKMLKILIS